MPTQCRAFKRLKNDPSVISANVCPAICLMSLARRSWTSKIASTLDKRRCFLFLSLHVPWSGYFVNEQFHGLIDTHGTFSTWWNQTLPQPHTKNISPPILTSFILFFASLPIISLGRARCVTTSVETIQWEVTDKSTSRVNLFAWCSGTVLRDPAIKMSHHERTHTYDALPHSRHDRQKIARGTSWYMLLRNAQLKLSHI